MTDDYTKTKAIFNWVQDKIKYVAFEDGLGGFIPRSGNKVCSRRFGDCKDMASIITKMMEYASIEGHLTWIGSRDIPYTYTELPTPNVDNHMIAAYKHNGEYIFLDATDEFVKFGRPSAFTQGKEALIRLSQDEYEIIEVPTMPAESNARNLQVELEISESEIKGNGKLSLTGYVKTNNRRSFQNLDKEEEEQILDYYLELGSNKFGVESYNIKNLEDRNEPTNIDFTFTLPD